MGPSEHVHGCIGHHYGNMQDYECVDGMQVDVKEGCGWVMKESEKCGMQRVGHE